MTAHVYLLDTNVLLAALLAPERLPKQVVMNLIDPNNTVYFSSASIWEVAIKRSLNRSHFDFNPDDIHKLAKDTGFSELPVKSEHCYPLVNLPWHHRDPFDRLLIVQALSLPAYLLTTDGVLSQYTDLVVHLTLIS
jgi:PIN domain nuclease of toxin-antitoxin system